MTLARYILFISLNAFTYMMLSKIKTDKQIIVIYGPTASGKTGLSIDLAEELDAIVINADSLQLFKDLPILTAKPTSLEMERVPHYLFGVLESFFQPTAMDWVLKVKAIIESYPKSQKIILVGGTGFYINVFLKGLPFMPAVSSTIKEEVLALAIELKDTFYDFVIAKDPLIHGIYHKNDIKRLSNALGVYLATDKSITSFLNQPPIFSYLDQSYTIYLKPERHVLHAHIEKRFHKMLKNRVVEEIKQFAESNDNFESLPVLNAVGAKEIVSYLKSEITYDEMVLRCIQKTRQYAKRQYTWFNGQVKSDLLL